MLDWRGLVVLDEIELEIEGAACEEVGGDWVLEFCIMETVETRPCEPEPETPAEFGNADVTEGPIEPNLVLAPLESLLVSIISSGEALDNNDSDEEAVDRER